MLEFRGHTRETDLNRAKIFILKMNLTGACYLVNTDSMGIDGLSDLLKDKYPDILETVPLRSFAFKNVVYDVSSHMYKHIYSHGREGNRWLWPFLDRMMCFRQASINVIPVFDGIAPAEKDEEHEDRSDSRNKADEKLATLQADLAQFKQNGTRTPQLVDTMRSLWIKRYNEETSDRAQNPSLLRPRTKAVKPSEPPNWERADNVPIDIKMLEAHIGTGTKNSVSITSEDTALLKAFFDTLKIPYLQASGEAEALGCYLVRAGLASAIISPDSDCIAHQTPVIIKDADTRTGQCEIVRYTTLCDELELDPAQLTDLCILLGTDYNRKTRNLKGIGPVNALKLIKNYGSIEAIEQAGKLTRKNTAQTDDGLRTIRCRELFAPTYPEFESLKQWDWSLNIAAATQWFKGKGLSIDTERMTRLWLPQSSKPTLTFEESADIESDNSEDECEVDA